MGFVFRLTYDNQTLRVDDQPIGWDESQYVLKRSKDGDGVFKEFSLDLTWIKAGAEFIRDAYEQEGIKAVVQVDVSIWDVNNYKEVPLFTGKLNMTEYKVDTSRGRLEISLPAENEDIETKFLSLRKKEVELTLNIDERGAALPALSTENIALHSQTLTQETDGNLNADLFAQDVIFFQIGSSNIGDTTQGFGFDRFIPISMVQYDKQHLRTAFSLGFGFTDNFDSIGNWFDADFDTSALINIYTPFSLRMQIEADASGARVVCGNSGELLENLVVELWYKVENKNGTAKALIRYGQNTPQNLCGQTDNDHTAILTGSNARIEDLAATLSDGDKIYTYAKISYNGTYKKLFLNAYNMTITLTAEMLLADEPNMNITGGTTADPSVGEGVLVYECLQRLSQHYLGQANAFKSDYYGRTDLGYASDGEGSKRVVMSGLNLRGFTLAERPFFLSWMNFFGSLFTIDGVSFGFETDAVTGEKIIRVEKIEYFYDSATIITLGAVTDLIKSVNQELYTSTVKVGYAKWFGQKQEGSLEEFNSDRQYYTGITQLETEEKKIAQLVAGSYSIESTRRLQQSAFDEDTEYDQDIFIISVVRTTPGEPTDWKAESDEDVISISNIDDPAGVYNIRLTPSRNVRRHGRMLASNFINLSLKTVSGFLKFSSGGGNYFVTSQLTGESLPISENADIDMNAFTPIWFNEGYEFEYPLNLSEVEQIKNAPSGIIIFVDNAGNEFKGFIKEVEMNMVSPGESLSTFKLLRAYE